MERPFSSTSRSAEFTTAVATIAAKAMSKWRNLSVDEAVELAWFSVGEVGDASIDDADLARHFDAWWSARPLEERRSR